MHVPLQYGWPQVLLLLIGLGFPVALSHHGSLFTESGRVFA